MPTLWVLIWLESIKQACVWTYDRIFQQLLLGFNKNVKNNATGYFSHSDKNNTETVIITIFSVNVRMLRSTLDLIVKCFLDSSLRLRLSPDCCCGISPRLYICFLGSLSKSDTTSCYRHLQRRCCPHAVSF